MGDKAISTQWFGLDKDTGFCKFWRRIDLDLLRLTPTFWGTIGVCQTAGNLTSQFRIGFTLTDNSLLEIYDHICMVMNSVFENEDAGSSYQSIINEIRVWLDDQGLAYRETLRNVPAILFREYDETDPYYVYLHLSMTEEAREACALAFIKGILLGDFSLKKQIDFQNKKYWQLNFKSKTFANGFFNLLLENNIKCYYNPVVTSTNPMGERNVLIMDAGFINHCFKEGTGFYDGGLEPPILIKSSYL